MQLWSILTPILDLQYPKRFLYSDSNCFYLVLVRTCLDPFAAIRMKSGMSEKLTYALYLQRQLVGCSAVWVIFHFNIAPQKCHHDRKIGLTFLCFQWRACLVLFGVQYASTQWLPFSSCHESKVKERNRLQGAKTSVAENVNTRDVWTFNHNSTSNSVTKWINTNCSIFKVCKRFF